MNDYTRVKQLFEGIVYYSLPMGMRDVIGINNAGIQFNARWEQKELFTKIIDMLQRRDLQLKQKIEDLKIRHELDHETYHNSSGGRVCWNCGKPNYDEGEECAPNEWNDALNKVIALLEERSSTAPAHSIGM